MTSPRQRKKRLKLIQARLKKIDKKLTLSNKPLEVPPPPVVQSEAPAKVKKPKNALQELKPQDQVVEQQNEEVKTPEKE